MATSPPVIRKLPRPSAARRHAATAMGPAPAEREEPSLQSSSSAPPADVVAPEPAAGPPSYLQAVQLLDTIPGSINGWRKSSWRRSEPICAAFPMHGIWRPRSPFHPGNHESAGERVGGKTRQGDRWLRQALIEAAHGAMRTKETYLSAQGRSLKPSTRQAQSSAWRSGTAS